MKSKVTISFIFLFIASLFLLSCSTKKKAKGPEDEIFVFSDSLEYMFVQDALKETFSKVINTPQPEELFHIKRQSINRLEKNKRKKNIIILAPLNSGTYTSKYLESIVDTNVEKLILNDSVFVINKYNLWAEDQLVMILSASNIDVLKQKILENKDDLLYYFRDVSNKRLAKGLYNIRFEKKDIEAHLLTKYGWMMYIQADYQLAMEKPEDNFVWLRRGVNSEIEKWIFVHWIENATPEFLNVDSISNERDRITEKYYRTTDDTAFVVSYDKFKVDKEVNFNNRYALMTEGLWKFSDNSGGGPYISYTFYDENTRRIYMLDASIFAPKYLKKSLLQQLDVLLHSFKTESEVDPIKKEEILEALK